MNNKNKSLPCYILEDNQYKFIGEYNDPERKDAEYEYVDNTIQIILPIERILNEDYIINSDGVIEYKGTSLFLLFIKKYSQKRFILGLLSIWKKEGH